MPVAHQIPDQTLVILHGFGTLTIADTRRLTDRRIISHIIDYADKTMIQNRDRIIQMGFHTLAHRTQRLPWRRAQGVDFGLLVWGQGHRANPLDSMLSRDDYIWSHP